MTCNFDVLIITVFHIEQGFQSLGILILFPKSMLKTDNFAQDSPELLAAILLEQVM